MDQARKMVREFIYMLVSSHEFMEIVFNKKEMNTKSPVYMFFEERLNGMEELDAALYAITNRTDEFEFYLDVMTDRVLESYQVEARKAKRNVH